jgi:GNAT superfamily N-acetyltransferase
MKIVDFDFDPDLLRRFLEFPHLHYSSDPNWLPDPDEARLLAPARCPSPTARWRNFLAVGSDGEQIHGRLSAIANTHLLDENGRPFGQIGFFECVDDQQTAGALVETALDWLRTNAPEAQTVLGPMNFDTWHAYRLRVSGFDQPTFAREPYNPPYYPALLERLGFAPVAFYVTKTIAEPASLSAAWEQHHTQTIAQGFTFRPLNPTALAEELALIYRLSLTIFQDNLFFARISESEFMALYAGTGAALDPELLLFILNPAGKPVGISFTFPDPRSRDTANIKSGGVLPAWRRTGLGATATYEVYQRLIRKGFTRINHCLMREGNRMAQFDRGAAAVTRRYALYSRPLNVER